MGWPRVQQWPADDELETLEKRLMYPPTVTPLAVVEWPLAEAVELLGEGVLRYRMPRLEARWQQVLVSATAAEIALSPALPAASQASPLAKSCLSV